MLDLASLTSPGLDASGKTGSAIIVACPTLVNNPVCRPVPSRARSGYLGRNQGEAGCPWEVVCARVCARARVCVSVCVCVCLCVCQMNFTPAYCISALKQAAGK